MLRRLVHKIFFTCMQVLIWRGATASGVAVPELLVPSHLSDRSRRWGERWNYCSRKWKKSLRGKSPSAKPIGRCAALWVLWRSIVTGTSPPSTGQSQHHSGSAKWGRWVAVAPVVLYAVCQGLGDFFSRGRRTWVLVKKASAIFKTCMVL